jgi:fructose-1,6-bisphosphatase
MYAAWFIPFCTWVSPALQIFGIYMIKNFDTVTLEEVLLPGKDMVAAGYCMYGSSCTVIDQISSTHARRLIFSETVTVVKRTI